MTFDFLTIRYGRRKDVSSGNDDFYDVLGKSPGFPQDAETIFREQLTKSVQWEGGHATTPYHDCFLVWKAGATRFLLARLIDAGVDSRGRPHTMRMDAVLIDVSAYPELVWRCYSNQGATNGSGKTSDQFHIDSKTLPDEWDDDKATFFASLCTSSAWPEASGTNDDIPLKRITLKPSNTGKPSGEILKSFERFFKSDKEKNLLIASHTCFYARGIGLIVKPNTASHKKGESSSMSYDPPFANPAIFQPRLFPMSKTASKNLQIVVLGMLFLGVCVFVFSCLHLWHLSSENRKYRENFAEFEQRLKELNAGMVPLTQKAETLQSEIGAAKAELKNSTLNNVPGIDDMSLAEQIKTLKNRHLEETQGLATTYENRIAALKTDYERKLEEARKSPDISLRNENAELTKTNREYERAVKTFRDKLDKIKAILE